ncbi:hypothetical protein C8F01DRAFT_1276477 [Mycena amicta]|nr:hypothetical protein C8F01DRAFT_1276477 [Mycena amicta]
MPSGDKSAAIAAAKPKVVRTAPDGFKKCTGTNCQHNIPLSDKNKKCPECRETNRLAKARSRAKKKAEKAEKAGEDETGDEGDVEREGCDERPKKKPRVAADSDADSDASDVEPGAVYKIYESPEKLFTHLRTVIKTTDDVHFKGRFTLPVEDGVDEKTRVQLTNREITAATNIRWTVHNNKELKTGHSTRYWCSQDDARKKPSKPSMRPGAKPRETPGMDRFKCGSRLTISCHRSGKQTGEILTVSINLRHQLRHLAYRDHSMPDGAVAIVREFAESSRPSDLVERVHAVYPRVSNAQIYNAWRTVVERFWKRDDNQMISAKKLLQEFDGVVDVFSPQGVPADVEILCWGMKQITRRLSARVVEIAMDATYNTNAKQLELYGIMAEFDNAGFPLAYCLLSTTASISRRKRVKALTAFTTCLRDTYDIHPEFTHVDKDMGEISALQDVWKPKISICWWHIDDAVTKRLKKAKLSTTRYKAKRAHQQFPFIALDFLPRVRHDKDEYEGGKPDDESSDDDLPATQNPSRITFTLPVPPPRRVDANGIPLLRIPRAEDMYFEDDDVEADDEEASDADDDTTAAAGQKRKRKAKAAERRFCPEELQAHIVSMMQQHAFLTRSFRRSRIPVLKVWAYLWENWYRLGRWELWARSAHPTIPRLRTTMICESHWRHIKEDYLYQFHSPRLDLLVWVLVTKLCPKYYQKLDDLITTTGRMRLADLPSWRQSFKHDWRALETRDISLRVTDVYRPDVKKWVCSCPAYRISRFLICKHLVQAVKHVPTQFFRQVQRNRTTPFWEHPTLVPLDGAAPSDTGDSDSDNELPGRRDDESTPRDLAVPDDEDDDDELEEEWVRGTVTYEDQMRRKIEKLKRFTAGLEYQLQFRDQRMLDTLNKKDGGFMRVVDACLNKEDRANNNNRQAPRTWENADAMFYRPIPRVADRNT